MNTDWERIKQVLAEAAAKATPAERTAYLAEACRGDDQLRAKVEKLLQAHDQAGPFLEAAVAPPTLPGEASRPPTEKPGDKIGRYKLLQQIGEGGCGVVYMAEQEEPIRRRVALKVIKLGMDTRQVIARFEVERQALALMDHPNIARVLDAGSTESGRPYFVMELVRGIRITDYCDENNLSTEARLNLFVQVCHAIQHAHQKGIIHRDIKPSNILITINDGVAVPKVIDFGIAKATDRQLTGKTLFTAFEQFIGTPAYMSPEQAVMSSLDIDTRSDIYALGVLLYELLTGHTPFDPKELVAAGLDEMRRIIREQEPMRPSTRLGTLDDPERTTVAKRRQTEPPELIHSVRGDLDWVVMKCLEKDRTRRYETANGLADDIQRHLRDETVTARPPGKVYRLQKLVRRNKMVFAAAAMILTALVLGLGFSLWSLSKERAARQRAVIAEMKAQAEAAKSQQVAQFLKDMLQGVGPSVALGRDTTMLHEILDKTAERVGKDLVNQPEVETDLRNTLGWVYYDLGDDAAAEKFHRAALALRRKLHGDEHPDVADSLHGLGRALWIQGKLAEAEAVHREALTISRKLFGNENRDTARALIDLARVRYEQGQSVEAEMMCREALSTQRKLLREPHQDIASSLGLLASTLTVQGKLVEAEALHREGLTMKRQLLGNKHPDVAISLFRLSAVLAKEGKFAEAESLLRESVVLDKELVGSNHPRGPMSLCALANFLASQGKLAESEPFYREATVSLQKEAEQGKAWAQNGLAWLLATSSHAGMRDGANAVIFAEKAVAVSNRKNADYLDTLAAAYAEVGQFTKAISTQKEVIGLLPDGWKKEFSRVRLKLYETNTAYRDNGYEYSN